MEGEGVRHGPERCCLAVRVGLPSAGRPPKPAPAPSRNDTSCSRPSPRGSTTPVNSCLRNVTDRGHRGTGHALGRVAVDQGSHAERAAAPPLKLPPSPPSRQSSPPPPLQCCCSICCICAFPAGSTADSGKIGMQFRPEFNLKSCEFVQNTKRIRFQEIQSGIIQNGWPNSWEFMPNSNSSEFLRIRTCFPTAEASLPRPLSGTWTWTSGLVQENATARCQPKR